MLVSDGGGGSTRNFPALGFDPAPGDLSTVDLLTQEVGRAATTLGDGAARLRSISSSTGSAWLGDAADAFRAHAGDELPKALENAHESFAKAQSALASWSTDLAEYQHQAAQLEQEAEEAKAKVDQAHQHLDSVHANPFRVIGPDPDGSLAAEAAQKQQHAVSEATFFLSGANSELGDVIRRARNLLAEHDHAASQVAAKIESAPDNLAPDKPGIFSRIGHWIKDHAGAIGNILSDISAVASIVALVTPPPIDAIAGAVAVGASLGAMGMHLLDGDGWAAGLDALGAIPGVKAVAKAAEVTDAAKAAVTTVKDAKAAGGLVDAAKAVPGAVGDVASTAGDAVKNAGEVAKAVPGAFADGVSKVDQMGKGAASIVGKVVPNASADVVNGVGRVVTFAHKVNTLKGDLEHGLTPDNESPLDMAKNTLGSVEDEGSKIMGLVGV